jgi:hypothetical protein
MEIKTNHHFRPTLFWFELTDKEKQEYDYEDAQEWSYFRYKGWAYTLADFMRVGAHSPFQGWDAYHGGSFFSGVVIKLSDCGEAVKVGTYYS